MPINSLRSALLLGVNAIVITVLALTAWATYRNTLHELNELFDAELAQTARLIKSLTHDHGFLGHDQQLTVIELPKFVDDDALLAHSDGYRTLDGHKYETKLGFQVWRNSTLILASENAVGEPLAHFTPGYQERLRGQQTWISFSHFDKSTGLWIFTAQREDIRSELSGFLARDQLLALLLTWVPISLAILWLVNRVLRPVKRYAEALGERHADQLQQVATRLPNEIEPIRLAVNALLQRITQQIERERRFINDAAHELRTPLAALKLHAEQLPEPQHPSSRAVRRVSERMNHLVDQLLILAKTDDPQAALGAKQPVIMQHLIEQVISELPLEAVEKTHWQLSIPATITLQGYPALLNSAIRNLLENSIKHGGEQPTISIDCEQHEGLITLTIADQGQGLQPDQLLRLGERFYRAEHHRQLADDAGLGLSIVARVVELHHGQLSFSANHPRGLKATLTLP